MADSWDEFEVVTPDDALADLTSLGFDVTSGFRTDEDVKRLKREGYTPAQFGAHNRGDGIDLTPGKSGMSLAQVEEEARRRLGPKARVSIHNGTHVHAEVPGWGNAPDVYRGDAWDAFDVVEPAPKKEAKPKAEKPKRPLIETSPAGEPYDGDTFPLATGDRGRLFGVDAFELKQTGRDSSGAIIPLGQEAREALEPFTSPDGVASPVGDRTYGRLVVTLENDGDAGERILREGYGLAEPKFLKGDERFDDYMEAERQARMNLLGAHGNTYQPPADFRAERPEQETAIFWDDPTPLAGLRPEIEQGYLAIWQDMNSKPEDLLAYAEANGFKISPETTRDAYARRAEVGHGDPALSYELTPRPMIDPGDGTFGAFARGFGDPINFIDELGGVVDSVGGTGGRENVWNSDRRFGDILWNNIDQNRDILAHDDEEHYWARLGGQVTSGVLLPGAAAKGLGQFVKVGAVEGLAAGAGAGEGDIERLPSAAIGMAAGAAGGAALQQLGSRVLSPLAQKVMGRLRRGESVPEAEFAEVADEIGGFERAESAAMRADDESIASRPVDRIDVQGMGLVEQRTAEMAARGEAPEPEAVTPTRIEIVEPGSEAAGMPEAFPERFAPADIADEFDVLTVRTLKTPSGATVKVKGPLDVTQAIRLMGGIRDDGGDLGHLGITNAARQMPFGRNEQFLGPVVNPEGRSLDEMGEALLDQGYFYSRPTPDELLDVLNREQRGQRTFTPEDLDEVAQFESALQSRYAAAELDNPPVVDVSEPAGADAPFAPVDVAQTAPKAIKAANINLSKIDTPEDIDALMKQTAETFGDFTAERRGVQTWEATEALAKDLGMTPDDLLSRRTGQAFNAEQALGARNLLAASAEETRTLAAKAVNGTEADKSAFVKSFFMHAAITEKAAGAAAEAGRALNIYRKVARAGLADKEAIRDAMKRLQDGASIDDIAQMVDSLADDPTALNRFARDAIKPQFKDKLMFVWINSLLSGPKTHVVNITSNLLTALMDAPERAIAAGVGGVRKAATGSDDRVLMSEVGPRLYGTLRGAADALRVAKEAWNQPATSGKLDAIKPAIGGTAGRIIGIPTRLLNVEDEMFKAMARRSEIAGMAVRKAKMEGLKGDGLRARIDQLTANPTEDMMLAATDAAVYRTFQRPLGPTMQKVSNVVNEKPALKLFIPFIRTPTNILKYAVERSPAAPLLKEVRDDFVAGGARRDMAVARMVLGTGIGALVSQHVASGLITGNGPADPSARRALEAQGWQPYSFKIGDTYISYRRLDPWATLMGTTADAIELQTVMTKKQEEDAGAVVLGAVMKNLTNKTWLSGLSDLVDAMTDPERNLQSTVTRLASSMATPTLASQVAQMTDPVVRDAKDPSYLQEIRKKVTARLPGQSDTIIPKRDISGREVRNEGGALARLTSPFDTRSVRRDPVAKAIYDNGARFSLPSREVGGERLTDRDYDRYQQVAARLFYDAMNETMAEPDWLTIDREERRKKIEKIKNRTRKEARAELFEVQE